MQLGKLRGIALATAAAGMFAMTAAGPAAAAQAGKVKCVGVNSCKGQSECKAGKSSCKGLNSCKGKGMMEMSKAECKSAKAEMKKKT